MNRSAIKVAKAGESAIRAVKRLARTESQEMSKEGKRENKRKILLGCALLEMMGKDATLSARVEAFMKAYLKRPNDRKAFDMDESLNFFNQPRAAKQTDTRSEERDPHRRSHDHLAAPASVESRGLGGVTPRSADSVPREAASPGRETLVATGKVATSSTGAVR